MNDSDTRDPNCDECCCAPGEHFAPGFAALKARVLAEYPDAEVFTYSNGDQQLTIRADRSDLGSVFLYSDGGTITTINLF